MSKQVTVAATQMSCTRDSKANIENAKKLTRQAASDGAQIVLIQELFESVYFPCLNKPEEFTMAKPYKDNPLLQEMSELAKELSVVLPTSFFEKDNNTYYNSLAVIDADGSISEPYRKSHIPDGPGYEEKYYFHPGNTGFKVFETKYAKIGVGICWDQWFPEASRIMALNGAELLFYPTAIGSEPDTPELDSRDSWQLVMQGHSAANTLPVIASNRIGMETNEKFSMTFYGSSFITDGTGVKVKECSRDKEEYIIHQFDLDSLQEHRSSWGFFRDRRTDLYKDILKD
ncbi:MAG: N-carbamoylputrescine amidase [Gammaproteobacteria bacterium]|nr:N-carbamoylputrescine amidase [Gammaproteobacteria bacterium]MAY13700.1 N-carbamoylputrescine amidase [Euryarchaeota archaeon]OUT97214.1 MAG: N-carbamoylputrescine amidase [Gammaproteobacteria bacterium TMED36]